MFLFGVFILIVYTVFYRVKRNIYENEDYFDYSSLVIGTVSSGKSPIPFSVKGSGKNGDNKNYE